MTESNVSIIDIAKKTGLSVATVSRVINGYQHVKPQTKERVLQAIAELGFNRNSIASSLRSKKTYTIGMIVPRISMHFQAEIITVIQNELYMKGYNLIICQSNDNVEMEQHLIASLVNSRVDGVVVACSIHTANFEHFDILYKKKIPVVFYDRVPTIPRENVAVVRGDDYQGGALVAKALIEGGCRNIAAVFGPLSCNLYRDRSAGFFETLQQHGITVRPEWIFYQELTYENAQLALQQMYSKTECPDGIFFANDTSAIAGVEYANKHGIKIPEELQLIGYSNDPRSTIITPSITTIEQFPKQFGCEVVARLMDIIVQGPEKNQIRVVDQLVIPVSLVKRKTTRVD